MDSAFLQPGPLELVILAVVGLLILGGIALLVALLANEKTRLVTIVLLALMVPLALVVAGGVFLFVLVDEPSYPYERSQPAAPAVHRDSPARRAVPARPKVEPEADAAPDDVPDAPNGSAEETPGGEDT